MARRRGSDGMVYVGIKGHVVALDRASGAERWRTKLEGVRMQAYTFVNLQLDGEQLYATFSGEVFCLDPETGEVRWHAGLRGLGTGLVTLASAKATPPATPAPVFEAHRQRNASQHSTGA